jgi:hypothetical protein
MTRWRLALRPACWFRPSPTPPPASETEDAIYSRLYGARIGHDASERSEKAVTATETGGPRLRCPWADRRGLAWMRGLEFDDRVRFGHGLA